MKYLERMKLRIFGGNHKPVYPDILDNKKFMDLVRRERCRSDHHNHVFSIIVFHSDGGKNKNVRLSTMLDALRERIRLYDSIGWFDDDRIGVMLPETPKEGAMKLCSEIHDLLQKNQIRYEIL